MINISRTEIVVQILEIANTSSGDYDVDDDGVMQTKIIHNTPLTSAQLKGYLKVLIERDLLSFSSACHRFKTTQKGRRFLEIYNKMGNVMEEEEQQQI
jgi:predicted transcriptional regulator